MKCLGRQILPGDRRPIPQDAPDLFTASLLMLRVLSQVVEDPGNAPSYGVLPCHHECVHLRMHIGI